MNDAARIYHDATKHSFESVRNGAHYLDWSIEPSRFKRYENVPSVALEGNKYGDFLYLIAGVTAYKRYPGAEYALRTVPSAGALYPNELYLQVRGVDGLCDGIYHYGARENRLYLLKELSENEGLEPFFALKKLFKGFLFLVSGLYYRSSWKYKERAFRYVLLDGGHILGSMEQACKVSGESFEALFDIELDGLNRAFSFGEEEFFISGALCGKETDEEISKKVSVVNNADVEDKFSRYKEIEDVYSATTRLEGCAKNLSGFSMMLERDRLKLAVLKRRSIRGFNRGFIARHIYDFIFRFVNEPFCSDCDTKIDIFSVVFGVEGLKSGIYKNGNLVKEGEFRKKCAYLCLEQALGGDSAFTVFLGGELKNYRATYQKCGLIGHRFYTASTYSNIGCSGIGAYYDDEVCEFLGYEGEIFYALALGV